MVRRRELEVSVRDSTARMAYFSAVMICGCPSVFAGTPAIDAALAAHYKHGAPKAYQYALVDLNGDAVPDAVVLISDPRYCGSGGCDLAILRGIGTSYQYVSGSIVSRVPMRVLKESRKGWKSLSVSVAGGGVKSGEVVLRFNGRHYPLNPTTQPHTRATDLEGSAELVLEK